MTIDRLAWGSAILSFALIGGLIYASEQLPTVPTFQWQYPPEIIASVVMICLPVVVFWLMSNRSR